ncbi:GIY-YIG nuclease family protein [Candidatus Uhrbacteria bacterium]|nr:GIY-YIG nuclease family protein [Candidatus Uhrbacteria bacterium]
MTTPHRADKVFYTYIATNPAHTVLYTGVTNSLSLRMLQHRSKVNEGFTKRYNVCRLVHYEMFPTAMEAIAAEKRVKGWKREKKMALIKEKNPDFIDLMDET